MKSSMLITLAIILTVSFDAIFAIPVVIGNSHTAIHSQQTTLKKYGKMFLRHQFGATASDARSRLRGARSVEKSNCRKVCYGNSGKCVTVCM